MLHKELRVFLWVKMYISHTKIVSEYDQELPKSQTILLCLKSQLLKNIRTLNKTRLYEKVHMPLLIATSKCICF